MSPGRFKYQEFEHGLILLLWLREVKVQLIPKISEPERHVEVNVTWMFMLGGSSQEGK